MTQKSSPRWHETEGQRPGSVVRLNKETVVSCQTDPQWGTADAEIKVLSVENPGLTNVLPLKLGVGQNIAMHASPTARNYFLVLISTFPVHSPSFSSEPYFLTALVLAWNKIGHPAHSHKRFKLVPVVSAYRT